MSNLNLVCGELIARCWEDEEFRKEFIANPEAKLQEAGAELEEGVTYQVIEPPKLVKYVVLPYEKAVVGVQEMAKAFLHKAEENSVIIPEGCEVRIIQNTEDTRYLILPPSPKTLTAAELKLIAGGGKTTTTVDVAITMVAVQSEAAATTTVAAAEAGAAAVTVAVVVGACVLI